MRVDAFVYKGLNERIFRVDSDRATEILVIARDLHDHKKIEEGLR